MQYVKNGAKILIPVLLTSAVFLKSCKKDECYTQEAKEDCLCPANLDPVCGCNGVTYGNSCEADCAGVFSYAAGACRR